jgi:hypothetical protein
MQPTASTNLAAQGTASLQATGAANRQTADGMESAIVAAGSEQSGLENKFADILGILFRESATDASRAEGSPASIAPVSGSTSGSYFHKSEPSDGEVKGVDRGGTGETKPAVRIPAARLASATLAKAHGVAGTHRAIHVDAAKSNDECSEPSQMDQRQAGSEAMISVLPGVVLANPESQPIHSESGPPMTTGDNNPRHSFETGAREAPHGANSSRDIVPGASTVPVLKDAVPDASPGPPVTGSSAMPQEPGVRHEFAAPENTDPSPMLSPGHREPDTRPATPDVKPLAVLDSGPVPRSFANASKNADPTPAAEPASTVAGYPASGHEIVHQDRDAKPSTSRTAERSHEGQPALGDSLVSYPSSVRDQTAMGPSVDNHRGFPHPAASRMPDPFDALDTDRSDMQPAWIRAGTNHAEAGYFDPSLGWVGIRADTAGKDLHAALVPVSSEAEQVLRSHLAGLNAVLSEHHGASSTITIDDPSTGRGGMAMGHGMQSDHGDPAHDENANQAQVLRRGDSVSKSPELRRSPPALSAPMSARAFAEGSAYISVMA